MSFSSTSSGPTPEDQKGIIAQEIILINSSRENENFIFQCSPKSIFRENHKNKLDSKIKKLSKEQRFSNVLLVCSIVSEIFSSFFFVTFVTSLAFLKKRNIAVLCLSFVGGGATILTTSLLVFSIFFKINKGKLKYRKEIERRFLDIYIKAISEKNYIEASKIIEELEEKGSFERPSKKEDPIIRLDQDKIIFFGAIYLISIFQKIANGENNYQMDLEKAKSYLQRGCSNDEFEGTWAPIIKRIEQNNFSNVSFQTISGVGSFKNELVVEELENTRNSPSSGINEEPLVRVESPSSGGDSVEEAENVRELRIRIFNVKIILTVLQVGTLDIDLEAHEESGMALELISEPDYSTEVVEEE